MISGAEMMVKCLQAENVTITFGYPGAVICPFYDFLEKTEIEHVLVRSEQNGAHEASGFARASGKAGVCIATSGPGATNLITGLATAYMDSIPMVAITANVTLPMLGKDSFQEIDIAGVTMPITKHGYIVKDVTKLADTLRKAFNIARSGRPGPVLVDITKDVTANTCEYVPVKPEPPVIENHYSQEDIHTALELIQNAKKPYIYLGGGAIASGAYREVKEFAEKIDAPVCETLMGKGAFDNTRPRYTGMLGMHGTKTSNLGVSGCDLLIVLGARFSDRVTGNTKTFAKNAKILQIDVDAAEINKNIVVDASVVGDEKEVLKRILAEVPEMRHPEWTAHISELKEKYPLRYDHSQLTGPYIIEKLYELTKGDAIITTEVGQNQMWAAQYFKYKEPRTFLSSGGLGTMGYGLGAAIGAKMGRPDKTVVNIAGDGCFRMNMNEIATAVRCGRPLIEIVLNNHVLGMVRQWQTLFYDHRYSHTVLDDAVDFVKISEGMGAKAFRVTKMEEVEPAIRKALAMDEPVVLDCWIDQDLSVFPMVPAGASLNEVFDEEDMKNNEQSV